MTPFEIAEALRICLAEDGFADDPAPPKEICHRPGAEAPFAIGTAQDECCSGLAWVRVVSVEPVVEVLDTQDPSFNPCASDTTRVTLELGVARCNPFGTREAGPTCAEWTALALRMDQDRAAMNQAVCCAKDALDVADGEEIYRMRRGVYEPFPSSGNCAGGTLLVSVWIDCAEC